VHCRPPADNSTPLNKVCNFVAKFPQHYDRCGWSMYCRAEWSEYKCYPFMTEEARKANQLWRRQSTADVAKASASASKSLEDVVSRLSKSLDELSSHDTQHRAVEAAEPQHVFNVRNRGSFHTVMR